MKKRIEKRVRKRVKKGIMVLAGIAGLLVFAALFFIYLQGNLIGKVVSENSVRMSFSDNNSNCFLDGEVEINRISIGNSSNGEIYLDRAEYNSIFRNFGSNITVYIKGRTGECFGENSNLPFYRFWMVYDLQRYFDLNEDLVFSTSLTPRDPKFYREIQGFIRPEEARDYFNLRFQKFMTGNVEEDIDKITNLPFTYVSNSIQFSNLTSWQTPAEVLRTRQGDCKNWAIAAISLIKAYNPDLKCYGALWQTHMSVFCYFNSSFKIYDQQGVKSGVFLAKTSENSDLLIQENKIKVREMLGNYFNQYGLEANERGLNALISEDELFFFQNNEEFVDWILGRV